MSHLLLLITMLIFSTTGVAGEIGNQFVTAKLAHGASIDLPRSWQITSGNELLAIETSVGAAIDLSGYSEMVNGTEVLLTSSFPGDRLYAGVTITSTEIPGSTRSSASTLSKAQLKSGGQTIKQGTEAILAQYGSKTWGWTSLRTITLGRDTALHISYMRTSDGGNRKVDIYKIFETGRIFDVALSTSVASEGINSVVLKRIAESFKAP